MFTRDDGVGGCYLISCHSESVATLQEVATNSRPSEPRLPDHLEAKTVGCLSEEDSFSECILGGSFLDQSASHVEIRRCRIFNAELTSSQLPFLHLTDDVVENCDLSGAVWSNRR